MASALAFSATARPAKVAGAKVALRKPAQPLMRAVGIKQTRGRFTVVSMATPNGEMSEKISSAIDEAKETCEDGSAGECAAAWDNVEELSAEASHQKANKKPVDPLEEFCDDNPDADECRVYED